MLQPDCVTFIPCGVLSKLARAWGGVRPHRGFTEKFTAPGGPHLGHHHLPPIPRCRHHAPGAYRPCLPTYAHRERLSCTHAGTGATVHTCRQLPDRPTDAPASDLPPPRRKVERPAALTDDFPRPFVQTASFRRNYRLKRLPKPQKVERRAAAPGVFHGSRHGPRCAAPGASRARARPHMWGSQ